MGKKSNLNLLTKIRKEKEKEQLKKKTLYIESEDVVNNLIKYYNYKYFIEKEQLKSIANLAFCYAYNRYENLSKNEFKSLYYSITRNIIYNEIRTRIKKEKLNKNLKENKKNVYIKLNPNFLSKEAKEVISIIYNAPFELFSSKNKITQETIRIYLKKEKEMKYNKINSVFTEIKEFLKEVNYAN